jgi:hypothetical protein
MTLQQIYRKYSQLKTAVKNGAEWNELDAFVGELAELASGTPLIPSDLSEEIFNESRMQK